MICPRCGMNLPNDALFCAACGLRLTQNTSNEAPQVPQQAEPVYYQGSPSYQLTQEQAPYVPGLQVEPASPRNNDRRAVAIVLGVIVALIVVLCGIAAATSAMGASGTHEVTFRVAITGYDDSSSRVPVRISGTTSDGEDLDMTIFLAYSGPDVELPSGTYEAQVVGSPISSDGLIYEIPTNTVYLDLTRLGAGEGLTVSNDDAFIFVPISPQDMTDDQMADALAWARKDEESNADVGQLEKEMQDLREWGLQQEDSQTEDGTGPEFGGTGNDA